MVLYILKPFVELRIPLCQSEKPHVSTRSVPVSVDLVSFCDLQHLNMASRASCISPCLADQCDSGVDLMKV